MKAVSISKQLKNKTEEEKIREIKKFYSEKAKEEGNEDLEKWIKKHSDSDKILKEDQLKEVKNLYKDSAALLESFKQDLQEHISTEVTELTEATEPESLLNEYLNTSSPTKVRLSGHLNDQTYFHTVFLEKNGEIQKMVVTSQGDIKRVKNRLKELKKKEESIDGDKERYDYEYFEIGGKEYRFKHKVATFRDLDLYMSDNTVLTYLKDGNDPSKEVYGKVEDEVRRYWDHYNKEWFDIATAWIIHTYLINGIGYTAYLILKGKEDTGKSTLQKTLARLSYNGFFSGKSTPAVTSRVAHYTQASLNLDEFEKNADDEVQGVFNTGQRKGAKYSFTNMNKDKVEDQITALYSFCPKTLSVNSLYEFDSHFLSRAIILEATRTTRSLEKIENISLDKKQEFQDLRNHLLAYSLFNHSAILEDIEGYREEVDESGREADKLGLICGIIQHFKGKSSAEKIEEFLKDKKSLQDDQINQRLEVLFERVVMEFGEDDQEIKIKPKTLANYVNSELDVQEDYQMSSRGVGNKLRDYDILRDDGQSSRSGSSGETVYTIPRDYVIDSFTRYDLLDLRDKLASKGNNQGSVASVSSESSVNLPPKEEPARRIYDLIEDQDWVAAEGVRRQADLDKLEFSDTINEHPAFETRKDDGIRYIRPKR